MNQIFCFPPTKWQRFPFSATKKEISNTSAWRICECISMRLDLRETCRCTLKPATHGIPLGWLSVGYHYKNGIMSHLTFRAMCSTAYIHVPTYVSSWYIYNIIIYIYVRMYVCKYACMYVSMYVCTYVCMYVPTYVCMYVCMYVFMYVCMYVCMYACMCVCMYVRMYVCMHACMHVCMYACMYVCMYVCTYVCMHECKYACMYVCMRICMYVCMYVSMYVCKYVCKYVSTPRFHARGACFTTYLRLRFWGLGPT